MPAFHYQAAWQHIRQQPLARMLLLSLSLHVAVVMLVQPRSFPVPHAAMVINARLVSPNPVAAPVPPPQQVQPSDQSAPALMPQPLALALAQQLAVPSVPAPIESAKPAPAPDAKPQATTTSTTPDSVVRPSTSTSADLPSVPVMVDTNWYEARQLDVQPRASQAINPIYPPDAARRGQQGTVKLKLKVDEFGVVQAVEVEEGNPPGVFDESALVAFKKAHFEPAQKNGQPVRALIHIRVRYELKDL